MLGRETQGVAGDRPIEEATAATGWSRSDSGSSADTVFRQTLEGRRGLKLAACYARVSTDKQEKEQTIESQLDALKQAAEQGGYEVPPEWYFTDEGYSGALLDRPALDRLRDLASEGALEAVLIYSPDRLAREYAYQVVVMEELQKAGCEVVFLNHAFGESPEERMLLQMQGVFAEYERALIRERTRRGRLFAARQGRVNWAQAPYGYRLVPKGDATPQQLVVEEYEAEVVRAWWIMIHYPVASGGGAKLLRRRETPARARDTDA